MVGWGDVAPLPAFSSETIPEVERELEGFRRLLGAIEVRFEDLGVWSGIDLGDYSPSVVFGLETALESLLDTAEPDSKAVLGLPGFGGAISVNGLLVGTRDEILHDVRVLTESGCHTVKLKLGRRALAEDVEVTRAVRDLLGERPTLRLDANRCWTLPEAIEFGERIGAQGIAYIEEPLMDASDLPAFFAATGIPVGLDETLRELDPKDLEGREDVGAVILKPTLLGGLNQARRWANKALNSNILPVISSSFESGVGILGLARLASSLGRTDIAVGLDTYRWLKRDVITPRLRFENGAIHPNPGAARTYEVDLSLLHEIRYA